MKIEKNQVDKLNLELTVTVEAADYAPLKKKKLNERKRTAEFKGFRKGNVPMSLIEKVYGEQALVDSVNDLVGGELYKFINESGIYTLGEPLNSEKQPEIEKILDEKLMAMFRDPSFRIRYEWLDEIPEDPNGKLRVIISKVRTGAIGEPEHAGEDVGSAKITESDDTASDEEE